jgi:uncharacterized phosphosugar-binding protein
MEIYKQFLEGIGELIGKIKDTQEENINKASEILADCVADGKLIYVWGPGGHSSIFAEDVMYRKGELAAVNPIIDPGISLSHGAVKEINGLERVRGLGKVIIKYNRIKKGDVIIFGSAYGVNPVLIEAVIECREIGAKVIAITSPAFSDQTSFKGAKHDSGKVLYQLADIYIDCFVPYGDAIVTMEGLDVRISPVATIMSLISLKALMAETIGKLVKRGIKPPIWTNSLQEGGVESNAAYIDKIWGKVKSM